MDNKEWADVLYIKITDDKLMSVEQMHRRVYTHPTKGRFINTTSDGRVAPDENNVAVLAYVYVNRKGYRIKVKHDLKVDDIRYRLKETLKSFNI
jgi:hypothetical protein